ncbi:YCII-related [Burkholderia seminalis]|nr:YCII-related [Burkholderia seminalis]
MRANGLSRANGCSFNYGNEAYNLNTRRRDSPHPLCYKDRLTGAQRAGTIPGPSMYVIDIHYTASLERIDDALERHRAYLQPQFDKGIFIAAGPKVPREGGMILAARIDRDALDAILETDPFVTEGLATYRVTEFRITRAASGFNVPALP